MPPEPNAASSSCLRTLGCAVLGVVAVLLPLAVGAIGLAAAVRGVAPGLIDGGGMPLERRVEAAYAVLIADLGEDIHLTPRQPIGAVPVCDDVPRGYGRALRTGFALMRATAAGSRLYDLLLEHDICVGVGDLPYNTAYALSRQAGGDWSESTIVVDRSYVRTIAADVLAAILIHEATHLDRSISGDACYYQENANREPACTVLPNGVELDEEVVAHAAEAEWWIEAYGDDGKRFAWRSDYSENLLAEEFQAGPETFRTYVARIRSNPREGEGI